MLLRLDRLVLSAPFRPLKEIESSSSPSVSVISDSSPDRSSVVVRDDVDDMVLRELALFNARVAL